MRVLQVVHALSTVTGGCPARSTQWLAAALAETHDVAVAAPDGADADVPGATVHSLPRSEGWTDSTGVESGLERGVDDETVDAAFVELLESFDPDVVHFQHLKGTSATLPERCAERDVPALLTLHDFWTLCHRERLLRPDGRHCSGPESAEKCAACYADARERAEQRRADRSGAPDETPVDPPEPAPLDDHRQAGEDGTGEDGTGADGTGADGAGEDGTGVDGASEDDAGADATAGQRETSSADGPGLPPVDLEDVGPAVVERTERLAAAREAVDLLVAPSAFLRDRFVEFGTPRANVVHCKNGVRTDQYEDSGFAPDAGVDVGYVGRITHERGVHVLVRAFGAVDGDASLHVFGAFDPEADAYHAQLRDAAGDDVTFHGACESNARPFEAMDVLVVPSLGHEASPLAIQEAFAAGVPVVAADDGGAAELVAHGTDGLAVPSGDPLALSECLQRLVADPGHVQRLRSGVERPKSVAEQARQLSFLYRVLQDGVSVPISEVDLPF